jgi:hypothetical protein
MVWQAQNKTFCVDVQLYDIVGEAEFYSKSMKNVKKQHTKHYKMYTL